MRRLKFISIVVVLMLASLAVAQTRGRRMPAQRQDRPTHPTPMPGAGREAPAPKAQSAQQTPQTSQPQTAPPSQPQTTQQPPSLFRGQGHADQSAGEQRGRGQRFGDWLRDHQNLPVDQQVKLLEQERAFQQLQPDQQQRLRDRLQRFNNLPPNQRERRLEALQRLEELSPEQRRRAEDTLDKFRVLPEDRREQIRRAATSLSRLDPQQQQRVLDSPRMRQQFSDQERDILRNVLDLRIGPATPRAENP